MGEGTGATVSEATETAKREVEKTRQSVKDAKEQLSEAMRSVGGPPAEDEDQAVEQIEAIRGQLERDLGTLRSRVPDARQYLEEYGEQAKKVGIAVVGGVVALTTTVSLSKRRRAGKRHAQAVREQAAAIAQELARIDLEEVTEEERGGSGKLVAVALAAAGVGIGAWMRRRNEQELPDDLWADPPPGPGAVGAPSPADEVPPIPRTEPVPPTTGTIPPTAPGSPPA
jgi:hypothetical protein